MLGTAAAPIQVIGVDKPLIRQVWVNQSQHVQVSGLDVYAAPRAEPVVALADSGNITLFGNDVHGASVSNCISVNGGAAQFITIGPGNRVFGNAGNGIALGANGVLVAGAPLNLVVVGNEVFDNRSHGIDIESSYWRIEGNHVYNNGPVAGDPQGGFSGIHLFRPTASTGQACNGNEIVYN